MIGKKWLQIVLNGLLLVAKFEQHPLVFEFIKNIIIFFFLGLGALTHGDRRATESRDLSRFNIDNKYGRLALDATFKTIMGYEAPIVPPPADYQGEFFKGNF